MDCRAIGPFGSRSLQLRLTPEVANGGATDPAPLDCALHVGKLVAQIIPRIPTAPAGRAAEASGPCPEHGAGLGAGLWRGEQGRPCADRDPERNADTEDGDLLPVHFVSRLGGRS
jgi:hypothetical protein